MSEVKPVLCVIAKGGVVDICGQACPLRRSNSVAVSSIALAVTGIRAGCRIYLIASTPLNCGVIEAPHSVDARRPFAVVKVPTCHAIVGNIAAQASNYTSDRPLDATVRVAMHI